MIARKKDMALTAKQGLMSSKRCHLRATRIIVIAATTDGGPAGTPWLRAGVRKRCDSADVEQAKAARGQTMAPPPLVHATLAQRSSRCVYLSQRPFC